MKIIQGFCIAVCLLITACDDKVQPLDIEGTWWVTLGIDSTCEVGVSFSEDYLSIIMNDLEPDGCWQESVPHQNDVWVWDIDAREDVMLDSGFRQATLTVSDGMTEATVTLQETESGLTGTLSDTINDPFNLVTPWLTLAQEAGLEVLEFPLVRMDNGFESSLLGMWQGPCELIQSDAMVGELCELLEFQSLTQLTTFVGGATAMEGGGSATSDPIIVDTVPAEWLPFTYGVKHSELDGAGQWLVTFYVLQDGYVSPDLIFTLSGDELQLEPRDASEFEITDEQFPITLMRAP